jgi:hypothetical protein
MPLCPQITNTPVTVTQTADFTVSSVLPVVAATTTQVDAAQADATQAIIDAQIAEDAANAAAAVAASSAAAAAAAQASATAANATAASAVTTANSAATAAGTAQSTANTALANAATANTTAIAANTAAGVAQTTADGKNKATYSTSAPGSTANAAGDIWFQYGTVAPNVGRIIAQFTGNGGTSWTQTTISGLVIANIDAGNITTGTLTASVGISNPSGNFSVNGATGALVATGATITGNVTATSGTFTGTVNAGAGYFGTPTNGFSINSTGLVGVGTGTIVGGVIQGAQFTNGSTFSVSPTGFLIASAGTIGGLTLSGSSITSATGGFSVTSAGVLTAISGTIGGLTLASNSISSITGGFSVTSAGVLTAATANITGTINATGGYIGSAANGWNFNSSGYLTNSGFSTILYPTTAPGGNATTYAFYSDRGVFGSSLYASSSSQGAITTLGGIQADGRLYTAAGSFVVNTSGNITAVGSITATGAITTSSNISTSGSGTITSAGTLSGANITTNGNLTVQSYIYNPGYQVSTSGGAARINDATTPTARLVAASGSSIRFKKDVVDISTVSALNPKLLLQVPVKAFKYREDYLDAEDERSDVLVPGFIAEELDAIYPVAVDHDAQDRASRWSSDFIVPGMLALIQDLYKEVQTLKGE